MIFNRLNFTYNNTADFTALAENIVFNLGCGKRKFADKFILIMSAHIIKVLIFANNSPDESICLCAASGVD